MGGKASVILVLGFSAIFLVFGYNLNVMSFRSVDNYSRYFEESVAHNCAVSGANMAAAKIFFDNDWDAGFEELSFSGGTIDVEVEFLDVANDIKQISSTGTYDGVTKEVRVIVQPSNFAKFSYYSENEGSDMWWTSGDTVWGPMHLQDFLRVSNRPVFMGKVTVKKDIKFNDKDTDDPKFYGGFESGIHLPLPLSHIKDIEPIADAGGHNFTGQDTVYLTFDQDSLRFKYGKNDPDSTVLLADFAPNGLLYVQDGNARVKGVVSGNYSVAVWGPDTDGKIYIDDDIVYNNDPGSDPNSNDMLGLMARNDIIITDNAENNSSVDIQASIYSEMEGLAAENYDSRPVSGKINFFGSLVQKKRQDVSTFDENTGTVLTGFNKIFKYDDRMMVSFPRNFPHTGSYEIVSWQE